MRRFILSVIFLAALMSCSKEIIHVQSNDNLIKTKIALKGDYVNISTSPLTKAYGQTYYAFEIDSLHITRYDGRITTIDTTYVPYAEGIFESIENLCVHLEKNRSYRIKCTIVRDREDELLVEDGYVSAPFTNSYINSCKKVKINNLFIYGSNETLDLLDTGVRHIQTSNGLIYNARMDAYFGETTTDLIQNNSEISIDLVRYNYGIHYIINPPTEGVLSVFSKGVTELDYELNSSSSTIDASYVYVGCGTRLIEIKWTRNDGSVVDLSQEIDFKRNTMTTLKIDVNGRVGGTDLDFNYDTEMENKQIDIN